MDQLASLTARRRWNLDAHAAAPAGEESTEGVRLRDLRALELRTNAQSTSGLKSSQRTAPADSRSIATTKCPPSFLQSTEIALRKYPSVVPQRLANPSFSEGESEDRYARSVSITRTLPMGKVKTIPTAHLPLSNLSYDAGMAVTEPQAGKVQARLYEVRRTRLRELIEGFETMTAFAQAIDEPLNYVSRLVQVRKAGRKNLGEGKAHKIEAKLGLPHGYMDQEGKDKSPAATVTRNHWPFNPSRFPRTIWDALSPAEQRKAEAMFLTIINGIESERAAKRDVG